MISFEIDWADQIRLVYNKTPAWVRYLIIYTIVMTPIYSLIGKYFGTITTLVVAVIVGFIGGIVVTYYRKGVDDDLWGRGYR